MTLVTRILAKASTTLRKIAECRRQRVVKKLAAYDKYYAAERDYLYQLENKKKRDIRQTAEQLKAEAVEDRRNAVSKLDAKGANLEDERLVLEVLS